MYSPAKSRFQVICGLTLKAGHQDVAFEKRGQIQAPTFICTKKSPEHAKRVSSAEGVTPVQSDLQRCHFEVQS